MFWFTHPRLSPSTEDGGRMFLRNVHVQVQHYMVLQRRRPQSEHSSVRKRQLYPLFTERRCWVVGSYALCSWDLQFVSLMLSDVLSFCSICSDKCWRNISNQESATSFHTPFPSLFGRHEIVNSQTAVLFICPPCLLHVLLIPRLAW
jgi:hypothetical protein